MPDIRIVQNLNFPNVSVPLDWSLLPDGTLDDTHELETAVLVAIGTDALANPNDELPDPHSSDRRGWWGDLDAQEIWGAWPIGWRGWTLARSKITDSNYKLGSTVVRIQDMLHEALTPFVTNKIVSSFDLVVQRNPNNRQRIDAQVTLFRAASPPVSMQFQILWSELGFSIALGN
jgi:phage gp46-like protein